MFQRGLCTFRLLPNTKPQIFFRGHILMFHFLCKCYLNSKIPVKMPLYYFFLGHHKLHRARHPLLKTIDVLCLILLRRLIADVRSLHLLHQPTDPNHLLCLAVTIPPLLASKTRLSASLHQSQVGVYLEMATVRLMMKEVLKMRLTSVLQEDVSQERSLYFETQFLHRGNILLEYPGKNISHNKP